MNDELRDRILGFETTSEETTSEWDGRILLPIRREACLAAVEFMEKALSIGYPEPHFLMRLGMGCISFTWYFQEIESKIKVRVYSQDYLWGEFRKGDFCSSDISGEMAEVISDLEFLLPQKLQLRDFSSIPVAYCHGL